MTEELSLIEVMEHLAEIDSNDKKWTKEELDEAEAQLHTTKYTVEQAREIILEGIMQQKTKSGLFKSLSDSLCWVINNVAYKDEELR